jgi:hypothetical protein
VVSTSTHHEPAVDAYVREQEGDARETVAMLVELVRRNVPERTERIHHGVPWFWTHGKPFCYVAVHTEHVNLGFRHGAQLDDPEHLLEGTGASMRHIKLIGPKAVPKTRLAKMIKQAAANAGKH